MRYEGGQRVEGEVGESSARPDSAINLDLDGFGPAPGPSSSSSSGNGNGNGKSELELYKERIDRELDLLDWEDAMMWD
jgi:hypothetical protein